MIRNISTCRYISTMKTLDDSLDTLCAPTLCGVHFVSYNQFLQRQICLIGIHANQNQVRRGNETENSLLNHVHMTFPQSLKMQY